MKPHALSLGTTGGDSGEEYEQQEEEAEEDEVEIITPPAKKKETKETLKARIRPKKDKTSSSTTQFLAAFAAIQETSLKAQIEHEKKMQEEAMAFQAKLEQDRIRFEFVMSMRLQQSSSALQQQMMQSNQLFQAELFKQLFDKGSDKEKDWYT